MAYSAVPTKSVGETWSAAENNTYIRDNFAAGVPDIFTTKGDIAVASAADVAGRLGVGTNGYVILAASGETLGVKWAIDPVKDMVTTKGDLLAATAADTLARLAVGSDNQLLESLASATPGVAWVSLGSAFARYKRETTLSIGNASDTIVDYATSVYDPGSAVTTGASWKYTVPAGLGGYYLVTASVLLESNAGWGVNEYLRIKLYKNNALHCFMGDAYMCAAGTYNAFVTGGTVVSLAATDYIDVRAYQNSGGAINVAADGDASHIAIARLV